MWPASRTPAFPSACGIGVVALALALPAAAQVDGPAARLSAAAPALFPAASVADATLAGVTGARVVGRTEAQSALGLQDGDLIVAVDGRELVIGAAAPEPSATPTLTILRFVPGERPVLPPEVLGRQTFAQFVALPAAQQSPVRLARMLANQQMLVRHGVGVALVPQTANAEDAAWLAHANPLPAPWEDALRQVRDAMHDRVDLPPPEGTEAEEAARMLAKGHFVEAQERAQRAAVEQAAVVEKRGDLPPFQGAVALYVEATRQLDIARREFTAPGARFAVVVEPLFSSSATPLGQDILFDVERSDDFQIAAGLNTSLHWPAPDGGWPVFRDLDLLVEYAYTPRSYKGPHGGDELPIGQGVEPPVTERIAVSEHRVSFELTYRPTLLTRLRPMLRGGPAFFRASARSIDDLGVETMNVTLQSWGWVAGFGIDVYNRRDIGFRASLVGTVQQVEQEFCDDAAYPPPGSWERASNIPQFKIDEMRPQRGVCTDGSAFYRLESSAWQTGVMLAYEF